jgi:uncharacterized protein YndB with AHSA1/START domain
VRAFTNDVERKERPMSKYERSATIQAEPERVFAYVADVVHLPDHLPTKRHATQEGGERVRIPGELRGHPYDADGFFRVDQQARRVEWGSDGEQTYRGWLQVVPDGAGSAVTMHLSFVPQETYAQELGAAAAGIGNRDQAIAEVLDPSLASIRNQLEGQGGKIEPPAVQ